MWITSDWENEVQCAPIWHRMSLAAAATVTHKITRKEKKKKL